LNHKIKSTILSPEDWEFLQFHIRNVLLTYFAAHNFFGQEKYESLYVYNRYYSINNVFSQVAEKFGLNVYSIQNEGPAFDINSKFHVFSRAGDQLWLSRSEGWEKARHKPLNPIKVARVSKHLKFILGIEGSLSYSKNPDPEMSKERIYSILNLNPSNLKILIPTSSADERFALEVLGYLQIEKSLTFDSLDLIRQIVEIAPHYPRYDFIIRIHPREFPNKRENMQSEHSFDLLDFVESTIFPVNVIINLPKDGIPISNLALVSDVILNSTSTVGLDFAALGLKVVAFTPAKLFVYPVEVNQSVSNLVDAINALEFIDSSGSFVKHQKSLAFRWIYFKYFSNNIGVGFFDLLFLEKLHRRLSKVSSLPLVSLVSLVVYSAIRFVGVVIARLHFFFTVSLTMITRNRSTNRSVPRCIASASRWMEEMFIKLFTSRIRNALMPFEKNT